MVLDPESENALIDKYSDLLKDLPGEFELTGMDLREGEDIRKFYEPDGYIVINVQRGREFPDDLQIAIEACPGGFRISPWITRDVTLKTDDDEVRKAKRASFKTLEAAVKRLKDLMIYLDERKLEKCKTCGEYMHFEDNIVGVDCHEYDPCCKCGDHVCPDCQDYELVRILQEKGKGHDDDSICFECADEIRKRMKLPEREL